jgi:hypothetical protein
MFRKGLQPKTFLKNAVAAILVLTLSGAYCLFCCGEIKAAVTNADHCPLSKTVEAEHCNFSKSKKTGTSRAATSVNVFECCDLKFNFFIAKLEKNRFPEAAPVLANNFFLFLQSVKLEKKSGFTGFSYRAPVFENRDLCVRNCVFRI